MYGAIKDEDLCIKEKVANISKISENCSFLDIIKFIINEPKIKTMSKFQVLGNFEFKSSNLKTKSTKNVYSATLIKSNLNYFNNSQFFKVYYKKKYGDDEKAYIDIQFIDITIKMKKIKEKDCIFENFKQNILSKIAHELKTPLISMISITKKLKLKKNLHKENDYIDHIGQLAYYNIYLLNDIIEYVNKDIVKLFIEEINIESMLKFSFKILKTLIKHNDKSDKIRPLIIFDERIKGISIKNDKFRIMQILFNLLSNSVKFTYQGHIKLTAKLNLNFITITVSDTGIGFQYDKLKMLKESNYNDKERFFLGLSVSHKIALKLETTLHIDSEKGKNSNFSFDIKNLGEVQFNEQISMDEINVKTIRKFSKFVEKEDNISNQEDFHRASVFDSIESSGEESEQNIIVKPPSENNSMIGGGDLNINPNISLKKKKFRPNFSIIRINDSDRTSQINDLLVQKNNENDNSINTKLSPDLEKPSINNQELDSNLSSERTIRVKTLISGNPLKNTLKLNNQITPRDSNTNMKKINLFKVGNCIKFENNPLTSSPSLILRSNSNLSTFPHNFLGEKSNVVKNDNRYANIERKFNTSSPIQKTILNSNFTLPPFHNRITQKRTTVKKQMQEIQNHTVHRKSLSNMSGKLLDSYNPTFLFTFVIIDDYKFCRGMLENVIKQLLFPKFESNVKFEHGVDGVNLLYKFINSIEETENLIVFIDEDMEFMKGSQAIQIIRFWEKEKNVRTAMKIVSITAYTDDMTKNKIKASGGDFLLAKPPKKSDIDEIFKKFELYKTLEKGIN